MSRVPDTLEPACPREQLNAAQTEYHSVMPDTMLLGFADYEAPARRLAEDLHYRYRTIAAHRFPDGETKLRMPTDLPARKNICRSLYQPNDKLIDLLLAVETARAAGVQRITLAAPYLCYMRQDIAFTAGEAVRQRIVGGRLRRQ